MSDDVAPVRPTTSWLLGELDLQLRAAADALSREDSAPDLARHSVDRAREVLAQLQAQHRTDTSAGEPDDAALALVRHTKLAPEPASARHARAFAAQTCERWGLPIAVRNAAVDVSSELVSNAAAYGTGPVRLILERGVGHLLLRVWDDGAGLPRVLPYRPGVSEKGLGLRLVKQLSTHWGAAEEDGGKWVWARIALPEPDGG